MTSPSRVGQLAVVRGRSFPSPHFEVWNGNNNHRLTDEGFDSEESAREWIEKHGYTVRPKFTKVIGGWLFDACGQTLLAHHNEAGFSGRAWELWSTRSRDGGQTVYQDQCLEGMLPTRAACVERAKEVCA